MIFRTLLNIVQVFLQLLTGDWEGAGQTLQAIVRDWWRTLSSIFGEDDRRDRGVVAIRRFGAAWAAPLSTVSGPGCARRGAACRFVSRTGCRSGATCCLSEPKNYASPFRGLAKAGAHCAPGAHGHRGRRGVEAAGSAGCRRSTAPCRICGWRRRRAGAPIAITINIAGVPDAPAAGRASRDGVLAGLRAAGYR